MVDFDSLLTYFSVQFSPVTCLGCCVFQRVEVFVVVEGGGVLSGITLFGKYRRFCLFCLLSADTIVQIHPESNAAVVMITYITSPALGDSGVFMVPWLRALEQAHVMARSIQIRAEVPIYLPSILKNSS